MKQEDQVIREEDVDFFFVWTKRGRVPRKCHGSRESAEKEATRLARLQPDRKFIVLQAVNKISVDGDVE